MGSPYTVGYQITPDGQSPGLMISISGPAEKLAVILTDPKGKTRSDIIQKEELISNKVEHFIVPYFDSNRFFHVGTYVVTVKTIDPEAVVGKLDVTFVPTVLIVDDVNVEFGFIGPPTHTIGPGLYPKKLTLVARKTGNVPVEYFKIDANHFNRGLTIGGYHYVLPLAEMMPVTPLADGRLEASFQGTFVNLDGDRLLIKPQSNCIVKGSFVVNESDKRMTFEKEIVAGGR